MGSRMHGRAATCPRLKILAEGFSTEIPARKAELVSFILGQLQGDGLRRAWERLDELQRHAVSEAVHSPGFCLDLSAFSAKYGGPPPRAGAAVSASRRRPRGAGVEPQRGRGLAIGSKPRPEASG